MQDANNAFLDSNIILYALDIVWKLLLGMPCISLQVLNECSNVLNRKRQWSAEGVAKTMGHLLAFVRVEPADVATVRSAWKLQARYRFSYYDSLIISAALATCCSTLYSEDMQHGQVIEGRLTIINPFTELTL
jgi:predicted nucleic acid-binding protein